MIYFKDSMRAQYFLNDLLIAQDLLKGRLQKLSVVWPSLPINNIIDSLIMQIGSRADQMMLPVIADAIEKANKTDSLYGSTPEARYDSFFILNDEWTINSKSILSSHPFLFERIKLFIKTECVALLDCLAALEQDLSLLEGVLLKTLEKSHLTDIQMGGSERHRGGKQTLVLHFSSSEKLVYKPTDLTPDILFGEFVDLIKLSSKYDLRTPATLPRGDYGWVEFIEHIPCKDEEEVRDYYRRAGVLLAVADSLNYCDGHLENLIASGSYPVLIDCETFFHAFSVIDPADGERSILFTGLIEKPPEKGMGYTAAFQTTGHYRYYFLTPYAINDRSDSIQVRYRGMASAIPSNMPVIDGKHIGPDSFVSEFIEGFSHAYDTISEMSNQILSASDWWERLSRARCRQIVRHTLYYLLLLRRIEQPNACVSREAAVQLVYPSLEKFDDSFTPFKNYEINDLLNTDTPYFWHYPESRDLIDGQNTFYKNYFDTSSLEQMRTQFLSRSIAYRDRSIQIIRNNLFSSSVFLPLQAEL